MTSLWNGFCEAYWGFLNHIAKTMLLRVLLFRFRKQSNLIKQQNDFDAAFVVQSCCQNLVSVVQLFRFPPPY